VIVTDTCDRFEPVQTELERHGDTVVVVVFGEIELSCAGRLNARLHELLGSAGRLVLDLSDARFIDLCGLHGLLDVDQASRAAGVEFALVPGPPAVQRLFEITGTDEALRFIAGC
jgi:anti-anti-sigma factor